MHKYIHTEIYRDIHPLKRRTLHNHHVPTRATDLVLATGSPAPPPTSPTCQPWWVAASAPSPNERWDANNGCKKGKLYTVCMHTNLHIYIYICNCTCIRVDCIYKYVYVCVYIYIYVYICLHMYASIGVINHSCRSARSARWPGRIRTVRRVEAKPEAPEVPLLSIWLVNIEKP